MSAVYVFSCKRVEYFGLASDPMSKQSRADGSIMFGSQCSRCKLIQSKHKLPNLRHTPYVMMPASVCRSLFQVKNILLSMLFITCGLNECANES